MTKAQAKEVAALETIVGEGAAVDWSDAIGDVAFANAVRDRQRLDAKIKQLMEAKAVLTEDIERAIAASGHKTVAVDDFRVTYVAGKAPTRKLDPKLVLAIPGVTAVKLAACYVEGAPGRPYVIVTEAK